MSKREMMRWAASCSAIAFGAGLLFVSAACNQVTGAAELKVDPLGGGSGSINGGGGSSGSTTSASSGTAGSTGGGTLCEYPKSGFGNKVGGIVKPGLTWDGFPEMSDTAGKVAMEDFYDCDGTKGVNAILVLTSATWCGACQEEATELKGTGATFAKWEEMGIKVITLMIEDVNQGQKATVTTAEKWKKQFKLLNAVVADPAFSFAPSGGGSIGLPYQVLVDPRTMKIVDIQEGYSGEYASTLALATKNAPK